MSLGPLYVLLGEVSVQVLCPFFNWVFCLPRVGSCEFFIYFGGQPLVQGIIGKYVFPHGWFSFDFNAVSFSHVGILCSREKKELIPFATAWMELESIMLSEISQEVKDKYHMISPIRGT